MSIERAWPSRPSARASVVMVGASRCKPCARHAAAPRRAGRSRRRAARRERAPRRRSAARDSSRWRSRRRLARSTGPTNTRPRQRTCRASASFSTTRCSGAAALASAIASRVLRVTIDAAVPRQRGARRSSRGHLRRHALRDRAREPAARRDEHRARVGIVLGLRDQVRGDPLGRARAATMRISVGPA